MAQQIPRRVLRLKGRTEKMQQCSAHTTTHSPCPREGAENLKQRQDSGTFISVECQIEGGKRP